MPPPSKAAPAQSEPGTLWRWVGPLAALVVFAAVGLVLHHQLGAPARQGHLRAPALDPAPPDPRGARLHRAQLLAAEHLRAAGAALPARAIAYARILFTSFIAYSFGHTLGFAAFTGSAIRFRLYVSAGITAIDVATVTAFCSLSLGIGLATVLGVSLLVTPEHAAAHPAPGPQLVAAARRAAVVRRRRLRAVGVPGTQHAGDPRLGAARTGPGHRAAAAAALGARPVPVERGAVVTAAARVRTCLRHLRRGLRGGGHRRHRQPRARRHRRVRDGHPLHAARTCPPTRCSDRCWPIAPSTTSCRCCSARCCSARRNCAAQRGRLARAHELAGIYIAPVVPQIAGALTFLAGTLLLFSGATPAVDERLAFLDQFLPLTVLEVSHLAGSVIGLGLLVLARALFRRVQAAYHISFWLLVAGIFASLLKGLDFEEALPARRWCSGCSCSAAARSTDRRRFSPSRSRRCGWSASSASS